MLAAAIVSLLIAGSVAAAVHDGERDDEDRAAAQRTDAEAARRRKPPTVEAAYGKLGVYRGSGVPDEVAGFERWLGRRTPWVLDFFAREEWSDIAEPEWWAEQWEPTDYRMIYSVPMLPEGEGSLAEGAAGSYNDHFRQLAELLVDHQQGNAVLRLGWEFNGNWYAWSAGDDPNAFVAYWRQIVNTMRAVDGARFSFDWSAILGGDHVPLEQAYPGDAYVDFIGMDVYDQGWDEGWEDPDRRWQAMLTGRYGLEWHRAFAAAHRKPMTYPEWGLTRRDDGHGGGDNPRFVQRMHDWIKANNVAYHVYFEFDADDGTHALMADHFPKASARFRQLFGPAKGPRPASG